MSETGEQQIERLKKEVKGLQAWKLGFVIMLGVAVVAALLCFVFWAAMSDVIRRNIRMEEDMHTMKVFINANNARFSDLSSLVFSGAQIVTANETVRAGGPIRCIPFQASVDKDGVVYPMDFGETCANAAWSAPLPRVYDMATPANDDVFIRCYSRADGRVLAASCSIHIADKTPARDRFVETFDKLEFVDNVHWFVTAATFRLWLFFQDVVAVFCNFFWAILPMLPFVAAAISYYALLRLSNTNRAKSLFAAFQGKARALGARFDKKGPEVSSLNIKAYNVDTKKPFMIESDEICVNVFEENSRSGLLMGSVRCKDVPIWILYQAILSSHKHVEFIRNEDGQIALLRHQNERDINSRGYTPKFLFNHVKPYLDALHAKLVWVETDESTTRAFDVEKNMDVGINLSENPDLVSDVTPGPSDTYVRMCTFTIGSARVIFFKKRYIDEVPAFHDGTYYSIDALQAIVSRE